jgi:hypothetical protein
VSRWAVVSSALGDLPTPNNPPVVNAGNDQTVGAGTLSLTFTATDPDGDILDVEDATWEQVSGPATLSPAPTAGSRTWSNIVFTTPGTYVLRATQIDPHGAIGTDTKTVTVSAGGAANLAEERLGLFARTGYPGDGAGPRPTLTKTSAGAVTFVQSYWEPDGLAASVVRELISPQDWAAWHSNVNGYLNTYKTLCQAPRNTIMLFAVPMFTGDEFTSTHESMRQAYVRGANGDFIADHWSDLRTALVNGRYGIDFPVYIDPCSEYDLGNPGTYPNNVGQAGRLNWGRMRDGAACIRAFYNYLKASCPLLEFGSCRISSGGTDKYMNINNQVETFGGLFPSGLDMSAALLYELNRQSAPLTTWFTWLSQNMYFNSEAEHNIKYAETLAAAQAYGIGTGSEEAGVAAATIVADNLAVRQFLDRKRTQMNALPASGPGHLKFFIYFEGLDPSCLYSNYPLALAHFRSTWGT